MMKDWYQQEWSEVLEALEGRLEGLSEEDVLAKRKEFGENQLVEREDVSVWRILWRQLNDFLVYFLILAGGISFVAGHTVDAYVILAVILINAGIGVVQEYKAEKSIKSLRSLVVSKVTVVRDGGRKEEVLSSEIVRGDIIVLNAGDNVPADARLIEVNNFSVEESSLTGESDGIYKNVEAIKEEKGLADKENMVWMGARVLTGAATAVVVAVGGATELGKLASNLHEIENPPTVFEEKVKALTKMMTYVSLVGGVLALVLNYFVLEESLLDTVIFAVAVVVAAIPEGLPIILMIILAIGANRMAKNRAIIRELPATETFGVLDVILTDKTGTLTENRLKVASVMLADFEELSFSELITNPEGISTLLKIAILNNDADLKRGSPTEMAILNYLTSSGVDTDAIKNRYEILEELPFDSKFKLKATVVREIGAENKELLVTGAPEYLLEKCSEYFDSVSGETKIFSDEEKLEFVDKINELSLRGLRVLAFASCCKVDVTKKELIVENVKELKLYGFAAFVDPPRDGVEIAMKEAKRLGIRVMMMTGDHKNTALAIAREVGLATDEDIACSEAELLQMSEEEFKETIETVNVFARLTPEVKLRILSLLQKSGKVVAMTGDGVNDSLALKQADIGIAMGIAGTDVARDASKVILTDDNFETIIKAVKEGRRIFQNIGLTSAFLITTNFAEIVTIILILMLRLPLPLIPIQILWLNLVTDTGPALALAMEENHDDVDPRLQSSKNIINKEVVPFLILMVAVMTGLGLLVFKYFLGVPGASIEKARTGVFVAMSLTQIFNMLNMRSLKKSLFEVGFFTNKFINLAFVGSLLLLITVVYVPFLQNVFQFENLSLMEFSSIFLGALSVLLLGELIKFVKKK